MEKFRPDLVVSDFDGTITQKVINWKTIPSLISILRDDDRYLDDDYRERAHWLAEKYMAMERDPNLSYEEKFNAMRTWWKEHHELLKEKWLTQKMIEEVAHHPNVKIREKFKEFVEILKNKGIPLIVFSSSGLGDESIKKTFERFWIPMDNIIILSNKLKFDENGKFVGVDDKDLIHWMNKDLSHHVEKKEIKKAIEWKKNVLVLWDSLHDPDMVKNMDFEKVLKIWFFLPRESSKKEEELRKWSQVYDIILPWDASFEKINKIIE